MPHSDHNNEYFHLPHDKKYCHYMKKFFQCNQNCMPVCSFPDNFTPHEHLHLLHYQIYRNKYSTSYYRYRNHPMYNLPHTSCHPVLLHSTHVPDWSHKLQVSLLHYIKAKTAVHILLKQKFL